jgi:antibiotic biosynthesis monooxygenase (ABM) superfamily enzyme
MIEDKFGCAEFYNLKQPFRKTPKYSGPFIVLLVLYFSTFLLNCTFVVRHMTITLNVVYITVALLPAVFLILATCSDPGRIRNKHPSPKNLFEIMARN